MNRVPRRTVRLLAGTFAALALLSASCGGDDDGPVTLTLIVYDSFPSGESPLADALAEFTTETGIAVEIAVAGDTGTMVSKAVLTTGNPEGDVMFGVDNTFLSRVLDADVFTPHRVDVLDRLDPDAVALVPDGDLTPVDRGDICVNVDLGWFAERGIDPPADLAALTGPMYRDLLVVQDPARSSPGLGFLLATIAAFGEDGWQSWWTELRANGVEVVDSWTTAYGDRFSGSSGGGPRPLVVSYGSSPVAEVLFADPPLPDGSPAPTGVIASSCFRQVEFAGVLRGTDHPDEAGRLVEFLVGERFQAEVPLNLFVAPARLDVVPPPVFVEHAVVPAEPLAIDPAEIERRREQWIEEWTRIVLG